MNKEEILVLDSAGIWDQMCDLHSQIRRAAELKPEKKLPVIRDDIRRIIIVGMGGSAISGHLVKGYLHGELNIPVHMNMEYNIPVWADEHTLVIADSHSGNTEETLEAVKQAYNKKTKCVCVTSGGKLAEFARKKNLPLYLFPGDMPPRVSTGYQVVSLLRVIEHSGLIDPVDDLLKSTADFVERSLGVFSNYEENMALTLANDLVDVLPVIYSNSTTMAGANIRWRNMFHENAKMLAFGNMFPELTHNEISGWEYMVHLTGRVGAIILQDDHEHPKVMHRMNVTADLIRPQSALVKFIPSAGKNRLERILYQVMYADFTSFYLAVLNETDPSVIPKIDLLKSRMNELGIGDANS